MSNPIEEGVAEEIEQKKVATRKFLKESGGTFKINKEIFEKVLAKFKGSIKRNYDVIVRADKMFQEKVYELCQIMIQKDEIPSEFRNTTLHMIYKGKGKREDHTFKIMVSKAGGRAGCGRCSEETSCGKV